jgi:hypothetical protein
MHDIDKPDWLSRFSATLLRWRPGIEETTAQALAQCCWPSTRILEPEQAALHVMGLLDGSGMHVSAPVAASASLRR